MHHQAIAALTADGYDEAVGFTVQQHLFARGLTRVELGTALGVPGPSVSNRLRGKIKWSASDIGIAAALLGLTPNDLMPKLDPDGNWIPAPYVPGYAKDPVLAGTGSSVAGEGLEPSTSRL